MNVLSEKPIRECTSCQMCAAVCPADALSIHLDGDGFYRPFIDAGKCVDCGLCLKVCYKFDNNLKQTPSDKLQDYSLYSAWARDKGVRNQTTSGGIADILAKQFVAEGYKVIGVVYDTDTGRASHKVAGDAQTTDLFRGSKYIQSYSVDAFKEMVNTVKSEKYAIFGLPCQIYSIARYLENRGLRDNAILIDLYCHGCPSMLVWDKLSKEISQKTGFNKFQLVNWRSKIKGWGFFYIVVVVDGKIVYKSSPYNDEFYHLFFSNLVLNTSCKDCILRSTLEYTDIRLGDFWGDKFKSNNKGVSGVSVVTNRGEYWFGRIKEEIKFNRELFADFLPTQSWGCEYNVDERLRSLLLSNMKTDKDLKEIVRPILNSLSFLDKFKIHIREIIYLLPNFIASIFR